MANAIENSSCVLMCMTEAYKQSANCRAEAEYAFQLKKPIVPLIMQKNYKPNGWLGIILGSKIFVDFTKCEPGECFKWLVKELGPIFGSGKETGQQVEKACRVEHTTVQIPIISQLQPDVVSFTSTKNIVQPNMTRKENGVLGSTTAEASNWNQEQVHSWIKKKQLGELIVSNIWPCDGGLLEQYHLMAQTIPEFFFKSLNPEGRASLRDCAFFAKELRILFKYTIFKDSLLIC
jgi:hypothetical protein